MPQAGALLEPVAEIGPQDVPARASSTGQPGPQPMLRADPQDGSQATGMDAEEDEGDAPASQWNTNGYQADQEKPADSQQAALAGRASRSSRGRSKAAAQGALRCG